MNHDEIVELQERVFTVIKSCQTIPQLLGAKNYALLFVKLVPSRYTKIAVENINVVMTRQKKLVRKIKIVK